MGELDDKANMTKKETKEFIRSTLTEQQKKFVETIKGDYPSPVIAATFGYQQHKIDVMSNLKGKGLL